MPTSEWSRVEVEAIVDDYLAMLAAERTGTSYSKSAHRKRLAALLDNRSESSIEFKHCNISAALLDAGFPYIDGYKPRFNYQSLLADVLSARLAVAKDLHEIVEADAERPVVVPEVDEILAVLTTPPGPRGQSPRISDRQRIEIRSQTNYLEREARNRSLADAGELFVLRYETARLIQAGKEGLASKIEHTAKVRGDHEGYDILSFDESGSERLIEVKTTKYGIGTPFYVTRNELAVSESHAEQYRLYRLFGFSRKPGMYNLKGAISAVCELTASNYLATPR